MVDDVEDRWGSAHELAAALRAELDTLQHARRAKWLKLGLSAATVVAVAAGVEYRSELQARMAKTIKTQAEVNEGRQALLHDEAPTLHVPPALVPVPPHCLDARGPAQAVRHQRPPREPPPSIRRVERRLPSPPEFEVLAAVVVDSLEAERGDVIDVAAATPDPLALHSYNAAMDRLGSRRSIALDLTRWSGDHRGDA